MYQNKTSEIIEQDKQCTYNVSLKPVRATIVVEEP